MLRMLAKPPQLGLASRRAFKAAALTIELAGGRPDCCSMSGGVVFPTCIYHPGWRIFLLPTSCERPLLLAEAVELVTRRKNESALIVRLSTDLEPPVSFVTLDAIVRLDGEVIVRSGLLPCARDGDPQLALVPQDASSPALVLGSEGLVPHRGAAGEEAWDVETGISKAAAFFRNQIWGGL
ncbi:MAG TPA: hypothetical protein VGB04_11095 [Allosphingosinicella sp.]